MKKLLIIICALFIITGCETKEQKEFKTLEDDFVKDVTDYYNNNVVGREYPPFSCEKVTLSDMSLAGVDISKYTNSSCNISDVAAFVIVTDSSKPGDIKFDVIPNLNCGKMSSTVTSEQKSRNYCISSYFSE